MSIVQRLMSTRAGSIVAGLLVALMGVGLAYWGWSSAEAAERRSATVDAEIVAVSEVTCHVDIEFTVDGQAFTGRVDTTRVSPDRGTHHPDYTCSDGGRSSSAYAPGDAIAVAYDPADPTDNARPEEPGNSRLFGIGGGAVIALVGIAGAVMMGRKRRPQQ